MSLPARGAWIEIVYVNNKRYKNESLPARGAWIEIFWKMCGSMAEIRRSPHGERGLKLLRYLCFGVYGGRSPHGERGLKCCVRGLLRVVYLVAPRTGSVD